MSESNEQRHKDRQERVKLAVKFYKKGIKIPQIAKEISVSTYTVETYLIEEGIELNKAVAPKPKTVVKTVKVKKVKKGCPTGDQLIMLSIIILCLFLIIIAF
jgi:transposase